MLPGPRQCIQWKFYRSCWPSNVMRALASPETFQHHLRMCYSVRGNHRVPPVTEALTEDSHFTAFKGYGRTQYPWAPGLTIRQVVIGKDPEHVVWPALLSDPDWLLADHIELPE